MTCKDAMYIMYMVYERKMSMAGPDKPQEQSLDGAVPNLLALIGSTRDMHNFTGMLPSFIHVYYARAGTCTYIVHVHVHASSSPSL